MNDFSKEAASSLLVELGKTKGFGVEILFRLSVNISVTQGIKWLFGQIKLLTKDLENCLAM